MDNFKVHAFSQTINSEGKNDPEGIVETYVSGVCGEDYRLVTPTKAEVWEINVTIISELTTQNVHISIYEVIGDYPYNYEEQINAPSARGVGKANLVVTLNTSKIYEIWIRDAYAKPFTGTIIENWHPARVILTPYKQDYSSSDWPMFHGDIQNTGYSEYAIRLPFECLWKIYVGTRSASPVVKDGVVYLGNDKGEIFAINLQNGNVIWKINAREEGAHILKTPIRSALAVDDNFVYVSSWDSYIWALHKNNGTKKWEYMSPYLLSEYAHPSYFIYPSILLVNNTIFVGLGDKYIHAVNASTGKSVWTFEVKHVPHSSAAYYQGRIFVGAGKGGMDKNLYCIDAKNGQLLWKKVCDVDINSSPCIRDGIVFFGSWNKVYALNYKDGRTIWTYELSDGNSIESSPAISHKYVFICGGNWDYEPPLGELYCLDIITGKLVWKFGDNFTRISPVIANNTIFLGEYRTKDAVGRIYALDVSTGKVIWKYITREAVTSIPAIIKNMILIVDGDSMLSAYKSAHIVIDKTEVTSNRCSVNTSQLITSHLRWSHNFSDASKIKVIVNNNEYISDDDGNIFFSVTSNKVSKESWEISYVINYFFEIYDSRPTIIWDKVDIVIPELQRIDIGEEFKWSGSYLYDSEIFQGSLILNDTLTKSMVGEYSYKVMGISDQKYGLTIFTANDFEVIFDRVNIEIVISDNRIDVGEEPDITVLANYEYDSTPFQGSINFVQPLSHTDVSEYKIGVESINDPLYGLTTFTQNEAKCIWDRIKIVGGGVSQESTFVKNFETVWFKAEYEYDSEIFNGSKGVLYINGEPLEWSSVNSRWEKEVTSVSPTIKTFEVTGVQDDKYGLTTFNDVVGSLSIQWRQQGIPGFSYKSIIIGVMVGILLLWWMRRRS